jgi:hypothetical protein
VQNANHAANRKLNKPSLSEAPPSFA